MIAMIKIIKKIIILNVISTFNNTDCFKS